MDEVKNEKREENYGYNSGFSLYYLNYFDIYLPRGLQDQQFYSLLLNLDRVHMILYKIHMGQSWRRPTTIAKI